MQSSRRLKRAVTFALLAAALPAAAADNSILEEVVVTAQKREQNIQDVGITMNAMTGDQLQALGVRTSDELAVFTPGVHISGALAGQNSQYAIRGVVQNDFNDIVEAPNAVYLDEGYIPIANAQTFGLFDIERVEVLKGPQGTLFGRNATGGLVQYISRKPTFDKVDGFLELATGMYDSPENPWSQRVEGAIGGPLGERVAVRVAGFYTNTDDYLINSYPAGSPGAGIRVRVPARQARAPVPTWARTKRTRCAARSTSSRTTTCCCVSRPTTQRPRCRPVRTSRFRRSPCSTRRVSSSTCGTSRLTKRVCRSRVMPMVAPTSSTAAASCPGGASWVLPGRPRGRRRLLRLHRSGRRRLAHERRLRVRRPGRDRGHGRPGSPRMGPRGRRADRRDHRLEELPEGAVHRRRLGARQPARQLRPGRCRQPVAGNPHHRRERPHALGRGRLLPQHRHRLGQRSQGAGQQHHLRPLRRTVRHRREGVARNDVVQRIRPARIRHDRYADLHAGRARDPGGKGLQHEGQRVLHRDGSRLDQRRRTAAERTGGRRAVQLPGR